MGRVTTKKQETRNRQHDYKGSAPIKIDRFTLWLLRTVCQIPIFILLYIIIIPQIQYENLLYRFLMQIVWIFIILLVSDALAYLIAWWVNRAAIHKWGYLLNPKDKKERLRASIRYIQYVAYRAMSFVFGLVWILTIALFDYFEGFSFLIAWVIISVSCRALATFGTDYVIFSV